MSGALRIGRLRAAARGDALSAGLYFGANIAAKVIGFLYFLLLARWLGAESFGIITFVAAMAVIADTAADLGMGRLLLREAARDETRAPRLSGQLAPVKLACALLIFALVVAAAPGHFHAPEPLLVCAIFAVWVAASGTSILLEQVLHARGAFGAASVARVLPGLVQLGAGWLAHVSGGTMAAFALSAACGALAYLAVILVALARAGRLPALSFVPGDTPGLVRTALPYAMVSTLLLLSFRVEFLVLGQLATPAVLGVFGIAGRFYEAALVAPIAYATVMTPRIIRAHEAGGGAVEAILFQAFRAMSCGAVALAFLGLPLVEPVTLLLLPAEFAGAPGLLHLMLIGYPLHALHILGASAMLALSRQTRPALVMGAAVTVQTLVAVVLTTRLGVEGTAAAVSLSAVLAAAMTVTAAVLWLGGGRAMPRALAPAAGAALSGLVLLALGGPSAMLLAAAAVPAVALVLARWIPDRDRMTDPAPL
jgi:O-antigen/teichoic acid export membrane protein